jgi:DoxX-like family
MEILAMKRSQLLYWSVTGVMAAFMLMASIPDILRIPQAVEVFTHLGYPTYLLPFLGIAKTLAVITILAPGFLWLKEWAYAGLIFDLIGAFYSHLAVGDPPSAWMLPVIGLCLVSGSYLAHRTQPIGGVRLSAHRIANGRV